MTVAILVALCIITVAVVIQTYVAVRLYQRLRGVNLYGLNAVFAKIMRENQARRVQQWKQPEGEYPNRKPWWKDRQDKRTIGT